MKSLKPSMASQIAKQLEKTSRRHFWYAILAIVVTAAQLAGVLVFTPKARANTSDLFVSITSPADNGAVSGDSPTITGTATPNKQIDIFIDGSLWGNSQSDSNGNWSYQASGLAFTSHTVKAQIIDGNVYGPSCSSSTASCESSLNNGSVTSSVPLGSGSNPPAASTQAVLTNNNQYYYTDGGVGLQKFRTSDNSYMGNILLSNGVFKLLMDKASTKLYAISIENGGNQVGVTVIDTTNDTTINSYTLPGFHNLAAITLSADGTKLYIANIGEGLEVANASTGAIISSIANTGTAIGNGGTYPSFGNYPSPSTWWRGASIAVDETTGIVYVSTAQGVHIGGSPALTGVPVILGFDTVHNTALGDVGTFQSGGLVTDMFIDQHSHTLIVLPDGNFMLNLSLTDFSVQSFSFSGSEQLLGYDTQNEIAISNAGIAMLDPNIVDQRIHSGGGPLGAVVDITSIHSMQVSHSFTPYEALTLDTTSLPDTTLGLNYSQTLATSHGYGSPHFAVTSGSLPPGLSLNASSGAITGNTTALGNNSFAITATDNLSSATQSYSIAVVDGNNIHIITNSLADGTVGTAYSDAVATENSTGTVTYTVTAGNLPPGLSLNASSGAITGIPTQAQSTAYDFTITARDDIAASSKQLSIKINDKAQPVTPPATTTPKPPVKIPPVAEQPSTTPAAASSTPTSIKKPTTRSVVAKTQLSLRSRAKNFLQAIPLLLLAAIPWLLLLLALLLTLVQARAVHNEARSARKLRKTLDRQYAIAEQQMNFLALTSHYLNTPLTIMQGSVDLLGTLGSLPKQTTASLQTKLKSMALSAKQLLASDPTSGADVQ